MSEPNGYLIHGTAFSSKEAAFKALVSNHEQESWFHKIWDEDAQPYYLESQPQLTIPKSIAEKIDKFIKVLHFLNEFEAIKYLSALELNGDRTPQWLKDNPMLVFAYLAGKALEVDLVKVVADE